MPKQHREKPVKRVNPSGHVVWKARYTSPEGRRLSAGTFTRKRDAQAAIDAAYALPWRLDTVGGYLPRWLEEHPVSERTMRTNRIRINAVLDVKLERIPLRDWVIRDLRRRHAKDLVAHMLTVQGRAPEGARNILRTLSAMAEDAITDELADVNPWKGVTVRNDDKRLLKHGRELRIWSFEEMHMFAAAASCRPRVRTGKALPDPRPAPDYVPMLRLLADCGLRIGELFALERADLEGDLLHVTGSAWEGRVIASSAEKNHDRLVPVPPGSMALIRAMVRRIDTPWLFPTTRGKLWRYSNWHREVWQPTVEVAGIDPLPQEFRHSWTSHLRAAGIDPADLAEAAGHSVQTATARYTHPVRKSHDRIREAIG